MEKVYLPNEVLMSEIAQLLSEGREVVMTPKGNSMLPFIRGEVDKVRMLKPDSLQVGDIVLARFGERFVLHRIVALDGDKVTLMGDGNLKGTEQGSRSDVFGKVVEIITPHNRRRKPGKGRLWRKALPMRRYLLKAYRKSVKLFNK